MNKKIINLLLLLALAIIVVIVVADYLSTRPGKRPPNPYAFDTSEYERVDEKMISHHEIRQIRLGDIVPKAFDTHGDTIYLLSSNQVQVVDASGQELNSFLIPDKGVSIHVSEAGTILVTSPSALYAYNKGGVLLQQSEALSGNPHLSAIASDGTAIFVADAGHKRLLVFNDALELSGAYDGESGVSSLHGFILPSMHFDLAVNTEQELWVVNPGVHSLQLYSAEGRFRRQWGSPSFGLEGFSGCCNPSYLAFMPDGRFITSEKGLVRIKLYKESGELESVVAPPEAFKNGTQAPAVAILINGHIAALDFDKKMIRIFEENK